MEILYRLFDTTDPEERLENAILWKLLKDLYQNRIDCITTDQAIPENAIVFGGSQQPGHFVSRTGSKFNYWDDPAFIKYCNREVYHVDLDGAVAKIKDFHNRGQKAFVKATRTKYFTGSVDIGQSLSEVMDALIYSFIDNGPCLLVQEFIESPHNELDEYRYFVLDGAIVTSARKKVHLTPLDEWSKPDDEYERLAYKVLETTKYRDFVMDLGLTRDLEPGVIEFNPMIPGRIGLFNCNVHRLARCIYTTKLEERIHLYQD